MDGGKTMMKNVIVDFSIVTVMYFVHWCDVQYEEYEAIIQDMVICVKVRICAYILHSSIYF